MGNMRNMAVGGTAETTQIASTTEDIGTMMTLMIEDVVAGMVGVTEPPITATSRDHRHLGPMMKLVLEDLAADVVAATTSMRTTNQATGMAAMRISVVSSAPVAGSVVGVGPPMGEGMQRVVQIKGPTTVEGNAAAVGMTEGKAVLAAAGPLGEVMIAVAPSQTCQYEDASMMKIRGNCHSSKTTYFLVPSCISLKLFDSLSPETKTLVSIAHHSLSAFMRFHSPAVALSSIPVLTLFHSLGLSVVLGYRNFEQRESWDLSFTSNLGTGLPAWRACRSPRKQTPSARRSETSSRHHRRMSFAPLSIAHL
jgi:hypothetical protein